MSGVSSGIIPPSTVRFAPVMLRGFRTRDKTRHCGDLFNMPNSGRARWRPSGTAQSPERDFKSVSIGPRLDV